MEIQRKKNRGVHSFLLVVTALIWGTAFVAQSTGGDLVGPYTFNCIRSIIGGVVLLPVIRLSDCLHMGHKPKDDRERHRLLTGGIACGTALAVASNLQQMGIYMGTPSGKAGFLTACYILLVPVFGLFLGKKCGWNVWMGIAAAVIGLYLLCIHGKFQVQFSDSLLLLCAVSFAVHILVIDYFAARVDGVRMSCIQFLVCGILSSIPMFGTEMGRSMDEIANWLLPFADTHAWISILYAGVLSCGVAYTLQILGQRGVSPAAASLLMSLESVFSVLAGWVILNEALTGRELAGCVLIFAAVILAQMPVHDRAGGSAW